MPRKKTHSEFIIQANKIHHNKYNYIEQYVSDDVKLNIKCPIHGLFYQLPSSHLQGCGCPKCANEYTSNLLKKTNDTFLHEARLIHGDKYIYEEQYKGSRVKIKIRCNIHGIFEQTPDKHLHSTGCPKCSGRIRKTKEEFISEATIIHNNKYKYPGIYINARTDIQIECPKHGIFLQVPDVHLNGSGCPTCSSNSSKLEMQWLDSLGLPNDNIHRHCKIYIHNSYIKPDGFDPKTNTIYEFYGDYFHGNPQKYNRNDINIKNNKTFGELYQKTLEREELIKSSGYNLISIWESEWKALQKVINE
jgi:hypothetical protein